MKRRKQIVAFIALVSLVLSSYASDVLLAGSANPRSKPSKKDSQIVPKTFATPEPDRKRHFVRLVIGKSRMTFEGQEVTWGELPDLLEKVPNRNHTVLELAAASNDIESSPDFELAKNKVISLSGRFDFEYPSIIGIHALGSKGTKPDTASQKDEQVDINVKIAKLNIKTANLNRVIKVFGDPIEYTWNNHTFTKGNLPPIYILRYPDGFSVLMNNGKVRELRHTQPGYMFRGKLQIDSSLAETLKIVGKPKRTIQGRPKPKLFQDGVLYKDIDSKKGYCYYGHKRKGVRILFNDYKVSALYVTRNDLSGRRRSRSVNISSDLKSQASEFETFAKNFIRLLAEEDFSKAAENFDPTMKEALPEAKLREIWNSIIAQNGSFVEQLGFRREKILQYETVFVTCKFKKHVFDAKVVFNSSKQISGLFFVPSQAANG